MPPLVFAPSCRRLVPATMVFLALAVGCPSVRAQEAEADAAREFAQLWQPFAERHCLRCHDARHKKGGLVLEGREPAFDGDDAVVWTEVYDRLVSGEMPPPRRRRPPREDLEAVLDALAGELRAADLAQRGSMRRLNRVEYENAVRDLLRVDVELKAMLPPDAVANGFDNVGSALAISTEQMAAYLEAADRALDAAIVPAPRRPRRPDPSFFFDAGQVPADAGRVGRFDLRAQTRSRQGATLLDVGDAVVVFNSAGYVPTEFPFFAPEEGFYRLRVRAYAYQSDEPLVMSVRTMNWKTMTKGLVGYYEVGPEPQTFEAVHRLRPNDKVKVEPYRIGFRRIDDSATYPGPGVAIMSLEVEGPLREPWPPRSQRRLFGDLDLAEGDLDDAREVLTRFAPRAFRRPVQPDEVAPYVALVERGLAAGRTFEQSIRVALQAVLCSPEFLFVGDLERGPDEPVGDRELAERLACFLWSSTPDAVLRAETVTGRLRDPDVVASHVERMLADPRARALTENFVGQWLHLRDIDFTAPDEALYPEFDELLQVSMVEETERFFDELLAHDLSVQNFIDSDFAMLNSRLASHYGIEGIDGLEIRKVELPEGSPRGGVLTQASVLKVTANGTFTSPVLRGAWVLENIFGRPSPPPPAGVPAIEPDTRGATTVREQLARHRSSKTCSSCHQRIDPPGFALESFDPIGGWRDHYRSLGEGEPVKLVIDNKPVAYRRGRGVDAAGVTPAGDSFDGIHEFKALLLRDGEPMARCLTEKMLVYAKGRSLGFSDREAVERIVEELAAEGYGLRTLVHLIARELRTP